MVLDNVESHDVLERIMPNYGCGHVLITCRSELVAASVASSETNAIEVPAFTRQEGSEMLLKRLGLGNAGSDAVRDSSAELSDLLGGHALTLDVMARNMVARKKQLPEFVRLYKERPRLLHRKPRRKIYNPYYKRDDDLESLWAIPFEQLEPDEVEVLSVLSMCGPNRVPCAIFDMEEEEEEEIGEDTPNHWSLPKHEQVIQHSPRPSRPTWRI